MDRKNFRKTTGFGEVLKVLKGRYNARNITGMARFGIRPKTKVLGISTVELRALAKKLGRNHSLADQLWKSGIHEARLLACFIAEAGKFTAAQADRWVRTFDSWDICDQCCGNLIDKTPFVWSKIAQYVRSDREFIKRTGFVLMATLSVHDKGAPDEKFLRFFPLIVRGARDERNFVRKAVNWALRQIGKRNRNLNKKAIGLAKKIRQIDSKSARWIASNALSELESAAVRKRLY